jgi:hypothetical protein
MEIITKTDTTENKISEVESVIRNEIKDYIRESAYQENSILWIIAEDFKKISFFSVLWYLLFQRSNILFT